MNGATPPEIPLSEVDLGSLEFWGRDDDYREAAFATLRREAPISFWPEISQDGFPAGSGYWALTRFDDVFHVSRHPEIFSSRPNFVIRDNPPGIAEYFGSMIAFDDPRHQRLRSIVSRAFTPKVVTGIDASIRQRASRLVASLITDHPGGEAELASALAAPLPIQVICDMMGVPAEDHRHIFHWSNIILGLDDPELSTNSSELEKVSKDIGAYANALAEDRRANPREDLTTSLVQAEVDGQRLSSSEIASFFILLVVAGNETTRTAISHGMLALSRYPEQRDKWWSDFDGMAPTAVEEIVRWASPVMHMRRNLTRDIELNGIKMSAGDKVVMWYNSANRDESKFLNPWAFDLTRYPNPHVGFGAGGPHFCLGASLARREIRAVFEELQRQIPDIVAIQEPARLRSQFMHGVKSMPVAWTPPRSLPAASV